MKTLLIAALALIVAAPAMADDHTATVTTTTTADTAVVAPVATITYEQAFTSCTETTAAVAGDKQAAVKTCMTEKGFTLKEETSTTTTTTVETKAAE